MVIIGNGGMGVEVLSAMEYENYDLPSIVTFNNMTGITDEFLGRYPVIHQWEDLEKHFQEHPKFIVCIANPLKRLRIVQKARSIGGQLDVFHSKSTVCHGSGYAKGTIIQPGCIIPTTVTLHEGVFLNAGVIIGHDSVLHQYCSLGPGCRILGGVEIGEFSYIGTNSVILPGVKIGAKVRVGIGQIIREDVPDNTKYGEL